MGTYMFKSGQDLMDRLFEGDAGGGGGGGPTGPTQADLDKAYQKLRDAEAERDRVKVENRNLKASKDQKTVEQLESRIGELESERDTAVKERDEVKGEFSTFKTRGTVETAARGANFRNPKTAVDLLMYRKVDMTDDNKITKALNDLAQEDPGLLTSPPPPSTGPIVPQNTGEPANGDNNQAFNRVIRQSAGRQVA